MYNSRNHDPLYIKVYSTVTLWIVDVRNYSEALLAHEIKKTQNNPAKPVCAPLRSCVFWRRGSSDAEPLAPSKHGWFIVHLIGTLNIIVYFCASSNQDSHLKTHCYCTSPRSPVKKHDNKIISIVENFGWTAGINLYLFK